MVAVVAHSQRLFGLSWKEVLLGRTPVANHGPAFATVVLKYQAKNKSTEALDIKYSGVLLK